MFIKLINVFYYLKRKFPCAVRFDQLVSKFFPSSVINVLDSVLFKTIAIWEPHVSAVVSQIKGNLFLDIGASSGRYTILLGSNYKRIIAVEPHPVTIETLRRNVNYAKLKNIQLLHCAVSDIYGIVQLYLQNNSTCGRLNGDLSNKTIQIQTLTVASILRECEADLVKVDVEGAEFKVLKGAESVISKIKRWIVELHYPQRKSELENWFISNGYNIQWLSQLHIYAWQSK